MNNNGFYNPQNSLNNDNNKMPAQTKRVVTIMASIAALLIVAAIVIAIVSLKQSNGDTTTENTTEKTTEEIIENETTENDTTESTTEEVKEENKTEATEETVEEECGTLTISVDVEGITEIDDLYIIKIRVANTDSSFDKIYFYPGNTFNDEGQMILTDCPVGDYTVGIFDNGETDEYQCDSVMINGTESDSSSVTVENDKDTTADITISYSKASTGTRFDMVRGGYYFTPDGFENITQETYALKYVQEWQNNDLDMYIMITDAMQIDIPISVDEEYEQTVNNWGDSSSLSLNKKEEDGYIISGTTDDGLITYHKVKAFNDRYVSIYITYPASNSDTCNKIVEDFVFSFVYE